MKVVQPVLTLILMIPLKINDSLLLKAVAILAVQNGQTGSLSVTIPALTASGNRLKKLKFPKL